MKKLSLLLFASLLFVVIGFISCDDGGGGGGQGEPTPTPTASPPPGGGVQPEACDNCPCDYFNVPMTEDCWASPTFDPGDPEISGERCSLFPEDLGFGQGLVVFSGIELACPESDRCCRIIGLDSDTCDAPDETVERLNDDQVRACQACVEKYATALNDSIGLTNESPYMCATPPPEGGVPSPPGAPIAPVPQTGQTKCWDSAGKEIDCAGTGQDGDTRAGVKWPSPRFTDNMDGTIRDNLTGLIWLKNANCFGSQTWAQALEDANTLHDGKCDLMDGSLGGDWRLPNVLELASLFDSEHANPALPTGHPFKNVQFQFQDDPISVSSYWSSTTYSRDPLQVWGAYFSLGYVGLVLNDKKMISEGFSVFVLPVRARGQSAEMAPAPVPQTGQTTCWNSDGHKIDCAGTGQDGDIRAGVKWPSPRFTDNMDGTIRDNLTGLIWLKNANCFGRRTWAQALEDANTLHDGKCDLMDGSSGGDWRLPNVRELLSLIDFENRFPALPTGHPFKNVQFLGNNAFYWLSTTLASGTGDAWIASFVDGGVGHGFKTFDTFVLLVRGGS
jgi:hypothetical protein